jgi:hypothetical protein
MAFELGQLTQFSDAVSMLDPQILAAAKAVNLPTNKGRFYQAMAAPPQALTLQKYEIRGRSKTSLNGVIGDGAGTGWADTSTTTNLPVPATSVNKLVVGSVLKIEDEVVVVKSVNRTANTIEVFERGAGATAGAAHADATPFRIIGFAGRDTDLKNVTSRAETTHAYVNYVQTIFETIDYTQFEQLLGREALIPANHIALKRMEAMTRVSETLSVAAIQGVKREPTDDYPGMSAGLYEQLQDTSNGARSVTLYDGDNEPFTEGVLKAALDEIFRLGNPDTILVNQTNKNIINTFNNAIMINTDRTDTGAGIHIDSYNYEGKILQVMVDEDADTDKVAILTLGQCQKGFLQGDLIRFVDEIGGSSRELRESIQGSLGFLIEGVGYDHGLIYDIDNTAD